MEVHRKPDVKAIVKQLDQHMEALTPEQNLIAERFAHEGPVYIISVCERVRTKEAVLERLKLVEGFGDFRPSFAFGCLAEKEAQFRFSGHIFDA